MNNYSAITPLDGRYRKNTEELSEYFSEYALFKTRFLVEKRYFEFIVKFLEKRIVKISHEFTIDDYHTIKGIEKTTNHDIKALEYFMKTQVSDKYSELIHFGLTSHDINNTSSIINVRNCIDNVMFPILKSILSSLTNLSTNWDDIKILSKTHGQPATPSTIGSQLNVFNFRLKKQFADIENFRYTCKFGGATGGLNAHKLIKPDADWENIMTNFIDSRFKMDRELFTTQITNYDNLAKLLSIFQRINTILIDLCQDIWLYVSRDIFKLKIKEGEVGSSTMPHKINPIDFENSEGNLKLANSLIYFMEEKLPVSRMQRDLTDSTVIRNMGTLFGYMLQGYKSLLKGLNKLDINLNVINRELDNNWAVILEGIQVLLRYNGYKNGYDEVKKFSRNNVMNKESIHNFIGGLEIDDKLKNKMLTITPFNY